MDEVLASIYIILFCYLLGAIPISLVMVYLSTGQDLRQYGDESTTITNVWRVLGPEWGIGVTLGEVLKGYLIALLALKCFSVLVSPYLCLSAAMLGRHWPFIRSYVGGDVLPILIGGLYAFEFPGIQFLMAVLVITIFFSRSVSKGRLVFGSLVTIVSIICLPAPKLLWGIVLGLTQVPALRQHIILNYDVFNMKF